MVGKMSEKPHQAKITTKERVKDLIITDTRRPRSARSDQPCSSEARERRFHSCNNVKARPRTRTPTNQQHLISQACNSSMTEQCRSHNDQSVSRARRHAEPCPAADDQVSSCGKQRAAMSTRARRWLDAVAVMRRQRQSGSERAAWRSAGPSTRPRERLTRRHSCLRRPAHAREGARGLRQHKAPPDMLTGKSKQACLRREVPAYHEA